MWKMNGKKIVRLKIRVILYYTKADDVGRFLSNVFHYNFDMVGIKKNRYQNIHKQQNKYDKKLKLAKINIY